LITLKLYLCLIVNRKETNQRREGSNKEVKKEKGKEGVRTEGKKKETKKEEEK
jgi:hypothetical protein